MKHFTSLLFLFFLFSFATSGSSQEVKRYTMKHGKTEREFFLYIPKDIPKDAPVVIVLHGYDGNADPSRLKLIPVADKNGFAVCHPQGLKDGRDKSCWNVGYPFQSDMKINDVDFICALAKHLNKRFGLSKRNVFVTGISNGGEMCYLLAYKRPEKFAAVAPLSGLTLKWMYEDLDGKSPIPLFEIHGTEDRTSEWFGDLDNKGGWGAYIPVSRAVEYWAAINKCLEEKTDTTVVSGNKKTKKLITHKYVGGTNGNEVWLYELIGGTHSCYDDINVGEELWDFFRRFVK